MTKPGSREVVSCLSSLLFSLSVLVDPEDDYSLRCAPAERFRGSRVAENPPIVKSPLPRKNRTMMPPRSCDTFVCTSLPAAGTRGGTLFGKNADRPSDEGHEVVVRAGSRRHGEGDVVRCTYVTVPQARRTFDCVLSKPRWMWGAGEVPEWPTGRSRL